MLIEFSVGNYLSFKEKVTLSMVATDLGAKTRLDENNVFQVDDELSLIKSAAIYSANASGKSNLINLIKAIGFMRWFIINSSSRTQITDLINVNEFRLPTETTNQPSFFEIVFLLNKKVYRYGFELNEEKVISEWLYYTPNSKEYKYFDRDGQKIKVLKKFPEGKLLETKTRQNALFLSVAAQFNGKVSEQILTWLQRLNIVSGINNSLSSSYTLSLMEEQKYRNDILELIKKLDLSISDIKPQEIVVPLDNFSQELLKDIAKSHSGQINVQTTISRFDIKTIHQKYNSEGKTYTTE